VRRVLPLVVAALVATSCSGGSDDKTAPSSTSPETTAVVETTTPPSTEAVPETTVAPGTPRPPTTVSATTMGPGTARIVGSVAGPEGAITGALVKVERFAGTTVATADIQTLGGSWSLDSILGGSYRVTIFRPPDLVQTLPEVFFLAADETKTLATTLIRVGESTITASISPSPPAVGQPFALVVRFASGGVGPTGQLLLTPRPGVPVQLNVGPGVGLESPQIVISDGVGAATWLLRCLTAGPLPLAILVSNASSTLTVPACVASPVSAPPTSVP